MEEFDVIVIGSGPGGYVAAIRAAQLGFKVACVDKIKELGGTCLNVGCIPSKTLLHSSELYYKFKSEAEELGLTCPGMGYDFARMMERKRKVITAFNQGITGLFKKNKITAFNGHATLVSPTLIKINESQEISAKHIILATGSEPIALPFLPFDEKRVLSSTGALTLENVPKKMLVIGAGVIGVELGSVYSRLGAEVTFIEFLDRVCPTMDETLSKTALEQFTKQGMKFHLSSKVVGGEIKGERVELKVALPTETITLDADVVLVAIGRKPYTKNLGLENVGIIPNAKGFIPIDGNFRTTAPSIYAIGDLVDGPMLAHKASEEGVAVAEILAGKNPVLNYMSIPSVVYTFPEIASVGLSEKEAKDLGVITTTGSFPFGANSRAKCTHEDVGFVKIVADAATDKIIGVHIIGPHASELIASGVLAIVNQMTAEELASTCQAHPTLSEALKEAALALHKRALHR